MQDRKDNSPGVFVVLISLVMFASCASPASVNKPTPSPTLAPMPPEGVRIDKPVNVSFSTYSKEWPVGWQWVDPGEKEKPTPHDVRRGVLRVRIPNGKNLNADNLSAPRYLKAITGDFQIETRVKFLPKENYQGAGLLIYTDDKNYLRFERAYGGVGGGGEGIRIDVRKSGEYTALVTPNDIATDAGEVDLRLFRRGRVVTAYWRMNEESEWREAGEFESDFPETVFAGVVACNTAREVVAEFGYIRLLPTMQP